MFFVSTLTRTWKANASWTRRESEQAWAAAAALIVETPTKAFSLWSALLSPAYLVKSSARRRDMISVDLGRSRLDLG